LGWHRFILNIYFLVFCLRKKFILLFSKDAKTFIKLQKSHLNVVLLNFLFIKESWVKSVTYFDKYI